MIAGVLYLGGSAGIGKATALAFDANGAIVTITGRRKERLEAVTQQMKRVRGAVIAMLDEVPFPCACVLHSMPAFPGALCHRRPHEERGLPTHY